MIPRQQGSFQLQRLRRFINGILVASEFFVHENLLAKGFKTGRRKGIPGRRHLCPKHLAVTLQGTTIIFQFGIRVAQIVQSRYNTRIVGAHNASLQIQSFRKAGAGGGKAFAAILNGTHIAQRIRELGHAGIAIGGRGPNGTINVQSIFKGRFGGHEFPGFKVETGQMAEHLCDRFMLVSEGMNGDFDSLAEMEIGVFEFSLGRLRGPQFGQGRGNFEVVRSKALFPDPHGFLKEVFRQSVLPESLTTDLKVAKKILLSRGKKGFSTRAMATHANIVHGCSHGRMYRGETAHLRR